MSAEGETQQALQLRPRPSGHTSYFPERLPHNPHMSAAQEWLPWHEAAVTLAWVRASVWLVPNAPSYTSLLSPRAPRAATDKGQPVLVCTHLQQHDSMRPLAMAATLRPNLTPYHCPPPLTPGQPGETWGVTLAWCDHWPGMGQCVVTRGDAVSSLTETHRADTGSGPWPGSVWSKPVSLHPTLTQWQPEPGISFSIIN